MHFNVSLFLYYRMFMEKIIMDKNAIKILLKRKHKMIISTIGFSMEPLIQKNSKVIIVAVNLSECKRGDIVLFQNGDELLVHRIIGIDGPSVICKGDNAMKAEVIEENDIIAKVAAVLDKKNNIYCFNDKNKDILDTICKLSYDFWLLCDKGKNNACWNSREHRDILEYIEKHKFLLIEERNMQFEH